VGERRPTNAESVRSALYIDLTAGLTLVRCKDLNLAKKYFPDVLALVPGGELIDRPDDMFLPYLSQGPLDPASIMVRAGDVLDGSKHQANSRNQLYGSTSGAEKDDPDDLATWALVHKKAIWEGPHPYMVFPSGAITSNRKSISDDDKLRIATLCPRGGPAAAPAPRALLAPAPAGPAKRNTQTRTGHWAPVKFVSPFGHRSSVQLSRAMLMQQGGTWRAHNYRAVCGARYAYRFSGGSRAARYADMEHRDP